MKKSFGRVVTFIVLGTFAYSQENPPTVKDVTDKMQSRYEMIDDATASFTKHVKLGFSNIEQTYEGTIALKKPKKMRLETDNETVVTDGVTVWLYSPVNNQVIVDHYNENQNSISPENFLLNLPNDYYATLLGVEKGRSSPLVTLKLVPKDDRSFVKSVKIAVDEGTWSVRMVAILDVNDTETTYTIRDLKLNTNLPDRDFVYTPPAGVEVVDLR
ncbi:MAG TPA: outer membrane lipoprotein chaperone LolA [Bacteroidota bacterium]|nr:outer membrane lipoprotein chaperone LolA [Bacteroidota bacterium]